MKDFLLANLWTVLAVYGVLNLLTFALYGTDKRRARRGRRRISERCLLLFALFFGAVGALAGMYVFRHKTRHTKFVILVPLFLVLQAAAVTAALLL